MIDVLDVDAGVHEIESMKLLDEVSNEGMCGNEGIERI